MTKQKATTRTRVRHTAQYRAEALGLAERVGIKSAAQQLGLHESQLYTWRKKAEQQANKSEAEQRYTEENARLKRQLAEKEEELAIPKKGGSVLREKPEVKYAFMKENLGIFSVFRMASVLGVSRSGFYRWQQRDTQPSLRSEWRTSLDRVVKAAFDGAKERYGSPRVTVELVGQGLRYDPKTVAESMRRQGLRAKARKKFKATTNSNHTLPVAPNLLDQDFSADRPNVKWVGDITYLWTDEGWLYLATVIDLFSRRVIGWALSERMTADLACDALRMALWKRRMPRGVIVHTDRGSQYCSAAYQKLISQHRLLCSMSAKGNCYDNACAESFFHTLKVELVHGERFRTRQQMREAIFEYIEIDYNRNRRHSAIGYLNPEAYEALKVA
ncbi:IS3 family transposase [Isoalcanivorax pacificus]|uniref:IS3 family transposase n=1 Tax=Isoalcanivorax pacificus TaxID=1306787 RepID=UPI003B75C1DB